MRKGSKVGYGILITIGYLFNRAISFLMMPVFTRLLNTSDYGLVSQYTAWLSILTYVVGMALEYSVRNAYVDYGKDMNTYMSALCGLSVTGAAVTGGMIMLINQYLWKQMSAGICLCCVIHAYVHSLVNIVSAKYIMYEQHLKRVAVLLLPNLLSALTGVILIVRMSENRYLGRIAGYFFVYAPLGILILTACFRKGGVFYRPDYWRYALTISLPMVFHGLSNVLLSSFDRILLTQLRTDAEAGIYSVAYSFGMITTAIHTAIESIWIPWFTNRMREQRYRTINLYVKLYISIVTLTSCGLMLTSPEILKLMSPKAYWDGVAVLPLIILSGFLIFLYSIHVAEEIYYKANRVIAMNTFTVAVFNIVTDFLLIPRFGMKGAAFTTLVSYLLSFLMHYAYSRRLNRKLYPFRVYLLPLCIVTGMALASYVFKDAWAVRWGGAVCLGAVALAALLRRDAILNRLRVDDTL